MWKAPTQKKVDGLDCWICADKVLKKGWTVVGANLKDILYLVGEPPQPIVHRPQLLYLCSGTFYSIILVKVNDIIATNFTRIFLKASSCNFLKSLLSITST